MPAPRARVRAEIWRPHTRIDPIGPSGATGVLEDPDVRLEAPGGGAVAQRRGARDYFPYGRRWFSWDELDLAYFMGYALWNYFALPALLLRDDLAWTEVSEGVLKPRFPAHLPTHGRDQRLHFDRQTGLLRRYDYRPEVVVGVIPVTVGNLVLEHAVWEGIPYPSKRRVTPIRHGDGRPLGRPVTLVTIEVEGWRLLWGHPRRLPDPHAGVSGYAGGRCRLICSPPLSQRRKQVATTASVPFRIRLASDGAPEARLAG